MVRKGFEEWDPRGKKQCLGGKECEHKASVVALGRRSANAAAFWERASCRPTRMVYATVKDNQEVQLARKRRHRRRRVGFFKKIDAGLNRSQTAPMVPLSMKAKEYATTLASPSSGT